MSRSVRTRYPHAFSKSPVPPVGEGSRRGSANPHNGPKAPDEDPDSRMWWKQKPKPRTYPAHYSRADIERIADRLARNWNEKRGVRLGPEVAKLCETGLRMLLSEPSRERLMTVLCGRLNCPDKDNCDPCADKAREIVRMYQDERRKDWSL